MAAQLCRCRASQRGSCSLASRSWALVSLFVLALEVALAGPIGDRRLQVEGRKDIEGFRFLSTGACTINEHVIHKYGVTLAASDTIMAVGGNDGLADVQCISVACDFIDSLQFWWSTEVRHNLTNGRRGRTLPRPRDLVAEAVEDEEGGDKLRGIGSGRVGLHEFADAEVNASVSGMPYISHPMCERGSWTPKKGSAVQVAVKDSSVAFAGGGCVEVSRLAEHSGWQHVVSLPLTLALTCAGSGSEGQQCGSIDPARFGLRVAMDEGVLLAAAHVTMAGAAEAEPVVVAFMRLGAAWQQTDVLRCDQCVCEGTAEEGCFGAAVAVHDELVAVGFPVNNSVVLYRRHLLPSKSIVVAWQPLKILTSETTTNFGGALAIGSRLLVVGFPALMNSGAVVYRIEKSDAGVAVAEVLDTRERCCDIGLPCCDSSHVGASVALSEFSHYEAASQATVAVGDAFSSQVHAFTCNLSQVAEHRKHACTMSAAILPGYERGSRNDPRFGFGSVVAMGGQSVLVADAADGCDGGEAEGCGTVCEVASCAPGSCLMYDFSTDTDFCQRCPDPAKCPGGIRSCVDGEGATIWAMMMSTALFVVLFCCLYSLSAWARGAGFLEVMSEVFCCGLWVFVPGRGLVFTPGVGEEPLLDSRGAPPEESEESEDEGGYVPPVVREAFGMTALPSDTAPGQHSQREAPEQAGEGEAEREEAAGEEGEVQEEEAEAEEEEEMASTKGEKGDQGGEDGEAGPGAAQHGGEGEEGDDEGPTVTVGLNYFSCKVCFERPIQTVLVPCGHEALCRKCSKKMKTCPICRKVVQKVQAVMQG